MARTERSQQLRIIGGQWRGRRIQFPANPAIRPTSDRIRETLFNWLAPIIHQAICLDLFSGSGALGFEALSRGADFVRFVEKDRQIARYLKETLQEWQVDPVKVEVMQGDATDCLTLTATAPFNLVFLDPPFAQNNVANYCCQLEQTAMLATECYFYIEVALENKSFEVPGNWHCLKEKTAGQVAYFLFQRGS